MTVIKLCEDDNGYVWATALPDEGRECESGPILGPPEGLYKSVHNKLAEAGMYNAFDLMGRRPELLKILDGLGIGREYARMVYHIYQRDYFMEMNEDGS